MHPLYEGLFVRRSVRPSVRPSVGLSVHNVFFLSRKLIRNSIVIGKVETLFLDCNNLQKNLKTKFWNKILKQNFEIKF